MLVTADNICQILFGKHMRERDGQRVWNMVGVYDTLHQMKVKYLKDHLPAELITMNDVKVEDLAALLEKETPAEFEGDMEHEYWYDDEEVR